MPQTSASRRTAAGATVFDFVGSLARRRFACRLGSRGDVSVYRTTPGVYTIVHLRRESSGGEVIEHRIAQLREEVGGYQLYWKRGNGRWTAYAASGCTDFIDSIDACLGEISRDPFGCFWS